MPPSLIFSQKQCFPFNNLQRNLKLSCLSQALCLALVGFSTVAVAQQQGLSEITDLFGSTDKALVRDDLNCGGLYCVFSKNTGKWDTVVNSTQDSVSGFNISEFNIDYALKVEEAYFNKIGSNTHYIFNINDNLISNLIDLTDGRSSNNRPAKVSFVGGEEQGVSRKWVIGKMNVSGTEQTLEINAPNDLIILKEGQLSDLIEAEDEGTLNITSNQLLVSGKSNNPDIDNPNGGTVIGVREMSEMNIKTSVLQVRNQNKDSGRAVYIQYGGGIFEAEAETMSIMARIALHASGYRAFNYTTSSPTEARITIKSKEGYINGNILAAGKAFIDLNGADSTYHIVGNLQAGRHEKGESNDSSGDQYWIYEYPDAGTINLAGVNTTLDGNAKAIYGGIVNIKLNNGRWTGMAINDTKPIQADIRFDEKWQGDWDNPPLNYDTEGTINLTLNGANAIWNVTDNSQVTSITMKDHGVLNLAYAPTQKVTAPAYRKVTTKTFGGSNGIVGFRTNLDGGTDQLIITDKATGTHQATIAMSGNADLDHSADWLIQQGGQDSSMSFTNQKGQNQFSGRGMVTVWGLGFVPEGDEKLLETEEGLKQIAANTTGTGVGNWYLIKQEYFEPDPGQPNPDKPNPLPDEIVENLSIGTSATQALAYQADLDDLRTRLGEVRYGAQDGAWVKAFTKKEKIGDGSALEQDVNGINVGLDTLVAAQESSAWLVGGAFRYSNADQEGVALKHVSGELDEYSLKAYATWMHEQGSYADFVLQAGRYKQSLNGLDNTATGSSNAKYRTWGYGASVEVGHMFSFANDADDSQWTDHWFVEPQLQLAYFYAKGADYHTSTGLKVDQGNADFLMGRAGVAIGKKFDFSDANSLDRRYFQVSAIGGVKHDFIGGDQTIRYTGVDKKTVSVKADELDDTRFYYGVNFDWQLANNWRVYGQVSREEGEQYTKDYDFSLGLKYAF